MAPEIEKEKIGQSFGWWYFDFVTRDGSCAANVVLHETDIFGLKQQSYMSASVTGLDGQGPTAAYYRRDLAVSGSFTDADGRLSVNGLVKETEEDIVFNFSFPEGFVFNGRIIRLSRPSNRDDSLMYKNSESRTVNNWCVLVPHSFFEGEIVKDGVVRRIEGYAYVDRNWGSENIQNFVSDWVWGHFSDGETSIVFYDTLTRDGRSVRRFFRVENGSVSEEEVFESNLTQISETPDPSGLNSETKIAYNGGVVSFSLNSSSLMRSWIDKNFGDFRASYLRWASRATFQDEKGQREMAGVTEYLRIRNNESLMGQRNVVLLTGFSGAGKSTVARILSEKQGFQYIDSKDIYHELAKTYGYSSAREWLKVVGAKVFLNKLAEEVIKRMQQKPSDNFVLDVVTGEMADLLKRAFPNSNFTVIAVETEENIREGRIARRQNLTEEQSREERKFRDGFLKDSGVEQVISQADFRVNNIQGGLNNTLEVIIGELKKRVRIVL